MIRPLLVGRGTAGRALELALATRSDAVAPAVWLERDAPLPEPADPARDLLVIANPHALHAPRLLEAAERGWRFAISEKPAAVDLEQVARLEGLAIRTWICHGYRLLWGPRRLRRAVAEGRFGALVTVEGRYWQSSAAASAGGGGSWKDDRRLAGDHDVLLDLASHWMDLVVFLLGRLPEATRVRRWFVNAGAAHRDTHVHLALDFGDAASFGSVSKTVHGAGNELELWVLGEKAAASWSFADPDRIVWAEGRKRATEVRAAAEAPFPAPPFHGLGWMQGYARLVDEVVGEMTSRGPAPAARAATLPEHLEILRRLLGAVRGAGASS